MSFATVMTILFVGVVVKNVFDLLFQSITRATWRLLSKDLKLGLQGVNTLNTQRARETFKVMSFVSTFVEVLEIGFYVMLACCVDGAVFGTMTAIASFNLFVFFIALSFPHYMFSIKGLGETRIAKFSVNFGFLKNVACLSSFLVYLSCIR